VPTAFRSAGPRSGGQPATASPPNPESGLPPMPDLAAFRDELRRGITPATAAAQASAATASPARAAAPSMLQPAGSPFQLLAGTLIPAVLTSGINSDLPGQATALVRRNVYDTLTGQYLLVPQGSRLVGEYDSRVAFGQRRVLVAWHRLIFPDGRMLDLQGMPGADLAAAAGLHDKVNNHFVRTFGGAVLLAAISAGVQLSQPDHTGGAFGAAPTPSQVAAAALGQELGRVAAEHTRRSMDVRPTLEVRPGYGFNVEVTADLAFPGPYSEPATR
jgi:type IV secretion system protein TrbI